MHDLQVTALLALMVFLAFNVRVVTGFGSAILLSPMLSNFFPPKDVVVLMILMESLINVLFLTRESLRFRPAELYAGGISGIIAGTALFSALSQRIVGLAIGSGMSVLSLLMLRGVRLRVNRRAQLFFLSGVISGFMGVLTGVNGPQVVLALASQGFDASHVRSVIITYLMVIDTIILLAFALLGYISAGILWNFAIFAPSIVLAYLTGRRLLGRMDEGLLRRIILLAVLVSSATLVVRYSGVW